MLRNSSCGGRASAACLPRLPALALCRGGERVSLPDCPLLADFVGKEGLAEIVFG